MITLDESTVVAVVGYGAHGQAVEAALRGRGIRTIVVDDRPSESSRRTAAERGVDLVVGPDAAGLEAILASATLLLPTPGLPERHPVFAAAERHGVDVCGEFDLAAAWDDRPIVAITGTNGKTTVTTLVTEMLVASGIAAVAAGNMELPLVTAIDDPEPAWFVVEASSFRLGHARTFRPRVGTWLNLQPDHLDVHRSLEVYEAAKAAIWRNQTAADVAVANAEDPVVMRNLVGPARSVTFGLEHGDATVESGVLIVDGAPLLEISEMRRSLPHDVANALAAAVTALGAGASRRAVADTLRSFEGLAHRVQLVGELDGVRWYDDSKATTPHAVAAGVGGFTSAVLIAGGRNKGVDLSPMAELAPRLRGVIAIGEAATEVAAVFVDGPPVVCADSMADAVQAAAAMARRGDAVVLSPACTSYDWYANYGERGDDFARLVGSLVRGEPLQDRTPEDRP